LVKRPIIRSLVVVPDRTPSEDRSSRINPSRIDPFRSSIPDQPSPEASCPKPVSRSQFSHCARLVDGAQNHPLPPSPRVADGASSGGRPLLGTTSLQHARASLPAPGGAGGRAAPVAPCRVSYRITHRASLRERHCAVAAVHATGGRQTNEYTVLPHRRLLRAVAKRSQLHQRTAPLASGTTDAGVGSREAWCRKAGSGEG
jgi:hypothetical protein